MKITKLLFLIIAVFCLSEASHATITLPSTIGSNMVIQRESEFRLWGWADPGQVLRIKATWYEDGLLQTTADNRGRWEITIPTGAAGGPYGIKIISGKEEVELLNILLGDVWICSGQSNMEYTINMFGGWKNGFEKDKKALVDYQYSNVRLFTVKKDTSNVPKETCSGKWQVPDTVTVADFSATAWFYGLELNKRTGVPIGLVVSAWGGTAAEAWTPRAVVGEDPSLVFYTASPNANASWPSKTGALYNAMINPLLSAKIAGAIWYQGEANVNDAPHYRNLLMAMIRSWRKAWNSGDFPFYLVQLAPYTGYQDANSALLREAQFQTLSLKNTGMAVTLDIAGDVGNIHPLDKQDVGKRLALWALANKYNKPQGDFSGPLFTKSETEQNTIRMFFDHADSLYLKNTTTPEFYIAGDDRIFVPAKTRIDKNCVVAWNEEVKRPVAVRYAFRNDSKGNLYNRFGLPASSFRTDNWPYIADVAVLSVEKDPVTGKLKYALKTEAPKGIVHYSTTEIEPRCTSLEYTKPVEMPQSGILKTRVCTDGMPSDEVSVFHLTPSRALGAGVTYEKPYSSKYTAGGAFGLVDGLTGSTNFSDGYWQGFQGDNLDMMLDMEKVQAVHTLTFGFLNSPGSWIFMPRSVNISTSDDGKKFKAVDPVNIASQYDQAPKASRESVTVEVKRQTRFIKISVRNIGTCPAGHPGEGKPAWLFADEITVN
ncbi:MAG TPA: sialate O-acetylesterase [Bacteroidales bacterium]|nr:sialate O-acetylesterase [Bacteroidales bacterium]